MNPIVGLAQTNIASYPSLRPYSPSQTYPELKFLPDQTIETAKPNQIYDAVRRSFYYAGLDVENFGTTVWNPLGVYVRPGDKVLLKPNFVFHEYDGRIKDCMVTHGSIIRAVLDYVYLAGGPTAKITIADAPEQAANFDLLIQQSGLNEIAAFYHNYLNCHLDILDLRKICSDWDGKSGFFPPAEELNGDPLGYVQVDLATHSELEAITTSSTRFGIANYSLDSLQERHRPGKHQYLVSGTILDQNVIINLPKMKTHQKAGLTGALKNLVGINGGKDWLPHYRLGSSKNNGDEHPGNKNVVSVNRSAKLILQRRNRFLWDVAARIWRLLSRIFPKEAKLDSGAWYGNDTTWRMALDLNKTIIFADADGVLKSEPQRRLFCVMDGIITGEGNGPLSPIPKKVGVVLASDDPAAMDAVVAQLMGFNWQRLPQIARFSNPPGAYWFSRFDGDNIDVITAAGLIPVTNLESMDFIAPPGWQNYVERRE